MTPLPPSRVPGTIPALVAHAAGRFGDREAISEGDVRLSWREVDALRRRAGRAFIAAGVAKGDRVAIWAPNIHEWIIASIGLQSIGGILVPLNTRFKGVEAADILRRSNAKLLMTVVGFLGTDYPAMLEGESLPELERVVVIRGEASGRQQSWQAFLASGDAVDDAEFERRVAAVKPDDTADIMFTSGTTGKPKGAMLAHSQNIRVYEQYYSSFGVDENDVMLIIPPFFHSFGYKAGWLVCFVYGMRIVPAITFDTERLMQVIQDEKVSVVPGPPTIFHGLLAAESRPRYDLSSLRVATTGGAMIPVELVRRLGSDLKFEVVNTAYGLTECTAIISQCRRDDPAEKIATTAGRPFPGHEVRIMGPDNRPLPQGQAGEIVARGPWVMKGYFNDPEGTAKAIDSDGWLHTGDVGLFDEDGFLKVTDRIKDMYIVGGFNCYPAEIENILMQMPGVAQAAVIGIPDERMGEVGKAFIIRRAGAAITANEVIAWSREHMANFKVPREVAFVDAFPLTASGKVLKTELRARERA